MLLFKRTEADADLDSLKGENPLHFVAKHGFTEAAEEILSLGYQSLLQKPATKGKKDWPLLYAVEKSSWRMVKLFMEALSPR